MVGGQAGVSGARAAGLLLAKATLLLVFAVSLGYGVSYARGPAAARTASVPVRRVLASLPVVDVPAGEVVTGAAAPRRVVASLPVVDVPAEEPPARLPIVDGSG